jgi:hypothetical protein
MKRKIKKLKLEVTTLRKELINVEKQLITIKKQLEVFENKFENKFEYQKLYKNAFTPKTIKEQDEISLEIMNEIISKVSEIDCSDSVTYPTALIVIDEVLLALNSTDANPLLVDNYERAKRLVIDKINE